MLGGGAEMIGGRNVTPGSSLLLQQQQQRRVRSLAFSKGEGGGDDGLDLFSLSRRSVSITAGEESDEQNGMGEDSSVPLAFSKLPDSLVVDRTEFLADPSVLLFSIERDKDQTVF